MEKRTVHFTPPAYSAVIVGSSALVFPVDHPDRENVSNTTHVTTSTVVKVNADGSFETENSIYVPRAAQEAA